MNKKTIIIGLIITGVVIAGGIYLYQRNKKAKKVVVTDPNAVTDVDAMEVIDLLNKRDTPLSADNSKLFVDLYVKKSLFVDLKQYEKVFIGKNNLTDYVAHNYNVSFSDNIIPKSNPINTLLIEKIFLGCNIALDDKIQKLYQEILGKPEILKDNDILYS
jgi:hypothetical protein